jgi:hypothetical protein
MNDLASLLSQPVTLQVAVKDSDGKPTGETLEYKVHPLTYGELAALQGWVDSQFPDPYQTAWDAIQRARERGQPFNVTQEQYILRQAMDQAINSRRRIGTPEADELLLSPAGFCQVMLLGIRKGKPDFSDEDARRLFEHMTQMDIVRVYTATQVNMVVSDPKATRSDRQRNARLNGSSTSRRTRRAKKAPQTGGGSSTA